ncbi:uncharacterized protein (DUF305 family) [Actinoalloteichus hoggarensis]|uniref:Uncharacterized protein n=1 Tax=Actinoalloteichus hoggarensis TaxID=1470176 RepID=A0A221VZM4_9PSEU|nr:DUF305 domain-containing protein [Actinoalloteichus hoggarensis]ASO18954.1 hypothetical protein AHOG_06520 [Actinoalloteichus hoggarensis]MBB5920190.1 uncharacterized protein (DUF305 family) [Actinoalloteichus hoggarensis]
MRLSHVLSRLSVAGLLVVGLAGCTTNPPEEAASTGDGAPVIMPGAPGDDPRDATEDELSSAGGQPAANAADVRFVRMMIPHHEQAGELTALVPDRTDHEQLRGLASRISDAQGAEIEALAGWLDHQGAAGDGEHAASHGHDGHEGHGGVEGGDADSTADGVDPASAHDGMPGMATEEEIAELAEADGTDFDRLFFELMITHHEGAITMAEEVLTEGADVQVVAMAQDVLVTQVDEIETMRRLLAEL